MLYALPLCLSDPKDAPGQQSHLTSFISSCCHCSRPTTYFNKFIPVDTEKELTTERMNLNEETGLFQCKRTCTYCLTTDIHYNVLYVDT